MSSIAVLHFVSVAMMSILAQSSLCRYLCPNPELGTAILRSGRLGINPKIEDHLYSYYALVLLCLPYRISLSVRNQSTVSIT